MSFHGREHGPSLMSQVVRRVAAGGQSTRLHAVRQRRSSGKRSHWAVCPMQGVTDSSLVPQEGQIEAHGALAGVNHRECNRR